MYANIIVDISHEKLDQSFQYLVPPKLEEQVSEGTCVEVSFGHRTLTGYVVELTEKAEYEVSKIKPVLSVVADAVPIESRLIALAAWIRKNYGGTMNQALKTVLPVKYKKNPKEKKQIRLLLEEKEGKELLAEYERKHATARARLLEELLECPLQPYEAIIKEKKLSSAVIRSMEEQGVLLVETESYYRNPLPKLEQKEYSLKLNPEQEEAVTAILEEFETKKTGVCLLHGVTGSGKTEVYMELIAHAISQGKQSIVLIPEIALTFQTVKRFYERFGDRVSILHSRLSQGERFDQYERAKKGELDVVIGPRSALFMPFTRLGLLIIDEEHETSYKSETVPKYHARETAIYRARLEGAGVVLGSATPSVDSYFLAKRGEYRLVELAHRASGSRLPACEIIDLREELKSGNRSILSRRLQVLMENRLQKKQQIMLFLNRRGMAGFVSCRSCGEVLRCPHCDVSLSQHGTSRLLCHYCGYETDMVSSCPSCGSKYIGRFKAGTQKIQELVAERFPNARILRMDYDTTRTKDSYEQILSAFSRQEADILIGTQMIVKGHDFSNVTLVGVLAADMSLNVGDFHAAERTFQLLTQAEGRAGRGEEQGVAVIQTYQPDHFSIRTAKEQDYTAFYEEEILYRQLMRYPPLWNMLLILASSREQEEAAACMEDMGQWIGNESAKAKQDPVWSSLQMIGPADAAVARVNDIYRRVLYLKHPDYQILVRIKDFLEKKLKQEKERWKKVSVSFDFNPVSS